MAIRSILARLTRANRGALKIAALYLVFGYIWIVFSDQAAEALTTGNHALFLAVSRYKGWAFVTVTAGFLFWLIQNHTSELGKNEAQYRLLADNVSDVIWVMDVKTEKFKYVSPSVKKLCGYSPEEFCELTLGDVLTPDSLRQVEETLSYRLAAFTKGDHSAKVQTREVDLIHKDGSIVHTEVVTTLLTDVWGGVHEILGVSRDISERKRIEDSIEYLSRFPAESPYPILRVDPHGRILYANSACKTILQAWNMPSGFLPLELRILVAELFATNSRKTLDITSKDKVFSISIIPVKAENYVNLYGSEITEHRQAQNELRHAKESLEEAYREIYKSLAEEQRLARTDGLTGLCNRRYFFELAAREFNTALRYKHPLAVILFDADNLKQVNDGFGHDAGDRMLALLARTSAAQLRTVDVLARYGGDEFVILLPHTSAQQAYLVAERIREKIAVSSLDPGKTPVALTITTGIAEAIHVPQDESVDIVIRRADEALFSAKQAGRNCTRIFGENHDSFAD